MIIAPSAQADLADKFSWMQSKIGNRSSQIPEGGKIPKGLKIPAGFSPGRQTFLQL